MKPEEQTNQTNHRQTKDAERCGTRTAFFVTNVEDSTKALIASLLPDDTEAQETLISEIEKRTEAQMDLVTEAVSKGFRIVVGTQMKRLCDLSKELEDKNTDGEEKEL